MFQEIGLASLGAAEDEISKLGRPKNGESTAGCMKTVPLEYTYKGRIVILPQFPFIITYRFLVYMYAGKRQSFMKQAVFIYKFSMTLFLKS